MIRNYLKIALRTLWKQKGITAINVLGLAAGMADLGSRTRDPARMRSTGKFERERSMFLDLPLDAPTIAQKATDVVPLGTYNEVGVEVEMEDRSFEIGGDDPLDG